LFVGPDCALSKKDGVSMLESKEIEKISPQELKDDSVRGFVGNTSFFVATTFLGNVPR